MQVFEPVTQCVEPRLVWGQGFTRRIMILGGCAAATGKKIATNASFFLGRPPPYSLHTSRTQWASVRHRAVRWTPRPRRFSRFARPPHLLSRRTAVIISDFLTERTHRVLSSARSVR
jgi:hypothetical protein